MIVAYPHTVQYAGKRTRKGRNDDNDMAATGHGHRSDADRSDNNGGSGVRLGEYGVCRDVDARRRRYHVAFPYNDMEYYVGVAGLDARATSTTASKRGN